MGLDVNVAKTVYTLFSKNKKRKQQPIFFNGKPVPFESDVVVYLGGHMRYDGSMQPHVVDRAVKGTRAMGATFQIWKRYPNMTISFKCVLLDTLVVSVLKYACELWAWGNVSKVERVESQALRKACGLGPMVSGNAIRWWLGRVPIAGLMWKHAFRFWAKIAGMDDNRFEKIALDSSWVLFREEKTGWIKDMLKVFVKVGFVSANDSPSLLQGWDQKCIFSKAADFDHLVDTYWEQELRMHLDGPASKYSFLMQIHPAFGAADVVSLSWPWATKKALNKFVMSDHKLEIETHRFVKNRQNRESRHCKFCLSMGAENTGDEKHALDVCLQFESARVVLVERVLVLGIEIANHSSSYYQLLVDLDSYERNIRIQVWHAMAKFLHHISSTLQECAEK